MRLTTERDAGYTTLTVTWNPDDPDAVDKAFDKHRVSDGDHLEPEAYEAVRETYAELTDDE